MFKELKEEIRNGFPFQYFCKEKKHSGILKPCFLLGDGGRLILYGILLFAEVLRT
jgi:hypothetical protein